ncbi:aldo-keto reductase [Saccharata proteae CBS 121410]|uniref:Aldo-keto reductase n=1 Tax=Saccharata proteae CBS 121410 TaxID=1314787 RepID=A0A9P4I4C9_9PEZI|nr:aldo-keto reductase [Saccharata proteae CBS 121410]
MPPATISSSVALKKSIGPHSFIYGTAWKKDATAKLVKEALMAGFLAVDTAAQPKHYQEDLVGAGIRDALREGGLSREQIYIQTKFTPPPSQDLHKMPYDSDAPLETQLHTSVASSLRNLRTQEDDSDQDTTYIDCLLLHTPLENIRATVDAWKILESYVPSRIRSLGISNVTLPVLEILYKTSTVKPSVVQNRFYGQTAWDVPLRAFCREKNISYQSFWTLTGNPQLLKSTPVTMLASFAKVSAEVALYSLVMAMEVKVLCGTTNVARMSENLDGVRRVESWTREKKDSWNTIFGDFKHVIGEEHPEWLQE